MHGNSTLDSLIAGFGDADYELAFRQYCEKYTDDELCNSPQLEQQLTLDDMNVFSYRTSANGSSGYSTTSAATTAIGGYMFSVLLVLGVIGNLVTLVRLCMSRSNSTASSGHISAIIILNTVYLLCFTLTAALYFLGSSRHILTSGLFICMLWPPLLDLVTHVSGWTIALISLNSLRQVTHTSAATSLSMETRKFQERLKLLAVVVVTVFLNLHSTLLRDLIKRDQVYECIISSRVGSFYRYYYPWIKATLGIYLPWLVGVVSTVLTCVELNQRQAQEKYKCEQQSEQITPHPQTYTTVCWWYLLMTAVGRISFHIALYFNYNTDYGLQLNSTLWLAGELCNTAMHSVAFIFLLKPLLHHRNKTPTKLDKQQTLQC